MSISLLSFLIIFKTAIVFLNCVTFDPFLKLRALHIPLLIYIAMYKSWNHMEKSPELL